MGPAPRRAGLDGVTVLLLTHPGGPVVDQVLDALTQQRPRPERVVVMGLSGESQEARRAGGHPLVSGGSDIVWELGPMPDEPSAARRRNEETPVAGAVAAAMDHLPQAPGHWVWILHDDSHPSPGALEALVDVARRSGRVRVVGPKLVRADDPRAVLSVGHRMTRSGRLIAEEGSGLVDQGQFDDRTDVIGVPLPGALVRADLLAEIGGVEPAFDEGTEGLDLCWRAHLRGHRVVVAPQAVVAQGSAGLGVTSIGRHRRRARQVALARGSAWGTPWRAVRICVGAVLAALALLLVSRPRAALAELADIGAVLSTGRSLRARRRFRGRRQVRDRDLRGLFESPRSGWRATGDIIRDPWAPRPSVKGDKRAQAGIETGPVAEEADADDEALPSRAGWWSWWLSAAVLVSGLISLARWRDVLQGLSPGGHGVRGGELAEVTAGAADLWGAWALPWSGAGLGSEGQGPPWLLPLAGWTWLAEHLPGGPEPASSAAVATAWLLLLAPPAAAVTAYVAAGVSGGGRGPRTVVALVWATLAPLWAAVDQGRVGPVVVHVLAPVIVAGAVLALDRPRRPSRATPAVLGAALAGALAAWFVPGVLVWLALVAMVILIGAPGRSRWRAVLLIGVPTLLWGPWLLRLSEHPLLLAGGAGATASGDPVPAWQALLLHPGGPATPVLWWTAPLWVLALLSTLAPGLRGLRATSALCCALCGLGLALLVPWVQWGSVPAGHPDAATPVTTWPGSYLSLAGAGVLLAASQGATSLRQRRAELRAGHNADRVLGAAAAVLVLVTVVASLGTAGWRALGTPDPTLRAAAPAAPGVVTEQLGGPAAPRWLALVPVAGPAGYVVRYTLTGAEPGTWLRDRVREIALPAQDAEQQSSAVRELVDGDLFQATAPSGEPAGLPQVLTDLAIGYVTVAATAEHPLVERIDAVPGLTRISTPTGARELLWRALSGAQPAGAGQITSGPARVRLRTAQEDEVVPAGAHGTVREHEVGDPGPDPSTMLVSEPSRWADVAVARADGTVLAPRDSLPVRYDIPPGAQTVSITLPVQHRTWWVVTAALALAVMLVLLMWALGRRGRSR